MPSMHSNAVREPVDWWLWFCFAVTVVGFVLAIVVRNWPAAAVTGMFVLMMVALITFIRRS